MSLARITEKRSERVLSVARSFCESPSARQLIFSALIISLHDISLMQYFSTRFVLVEHHHARRIECSYERKLATLLYGLKINILKDKRWQKCIAD